MAYNPKDPQQKFIRDLVQTAIRAATTSLIWKLPRWMLIAILAVLVGIVVYFQMY